MRGADPSFLLALLGEEPLRALLRLGVGIVVDEDILVCHEETVDVLEGAVRRLGVEEVHDWHKGEVEHSPDYVEPPAYRIYSDRCDLDDHKVHDPLNTSELAVISSGPGVGVFCYSIFRRIFRRGGTKTTPGFLTLVAVPSAAPFVRIERELISVG